MRRRGRAGQVFTKYVNEGVSQKTPVRTDEQLRADYMRTFVKYALQGVAITHPEKVAIFEKKVVKRSRKKSPMISRAS